MPVTWSAVALILGGAAGISWSVIWALARLAPRWNWIDQVTDNPLKIHTRPIPLVGGFGLAAVLPIYAVAVWGWGIGEGLSNTGASNPQFGGMLLVMGMLVGAVGFADDLRPLPPWIRLCAELSAGFAIAFAVIRPGLFPDGGSLGGGAGPGNGSAFLLMMMIPLGGLLVAFLVNAINMQDGMDGYAGTLIAVTASGYAAWGFFTDDASLLVIALGLLGATLGFLGHNWQPARVFLGDGGSYLAGTLLGGFVLQTLGRAWFGGGPLATADAVGALHSGWLLRSLGALLMVGLPAGDALWVIACRIRRGVSPFLGDRNHLYDRLRAHGLQAWQICVLAGLVQALLSVLGVICLRGSWGFP